MTRSLDTPGAHRFRLPADSVVYHGTRREIVDGVIANGLRPRKPTGPHGNYRWIDRDDPNPMEGQLLAQPAGVYVVKSLREAIPWAERGAGYVWKIDAGGLTAVQDAAYGSGTVLRLVGRVRPDRLIGLYDCPGQAWVAGSWTIR